jgi:hypothetical protein
MLRKMAESNESLAAESNESLAERIAEASRGALTYETALEALRVGGRPRELALSILEAEARYEQDREELAEARRKLREVAPA